MRKRAPAAGGKDSKYRHRKFNTGPAPRGIIAAEQEVDAIQKRKKLALIGGVGVALLAGTVLLGLDDQLTVRTYQLSSEKLTGAVRLVLLSDLHSCNYREGQGELLDLVAVQEPDLVLLAGDWVDDEVSRLDPERAYTAARALAERWPTYYVTGNHELWSGQVETIWKELEACGVISLAGETETVTVRGQALQLCGVDDPAVGESAWSAQLAAVSSTGEDGLFRVLLSHRPERAEDYVGRGFDLVLSGHAHGGQWRIPGILNGLMAPNQGLFPQYAGGAYDLRDGATLIVSRGLARESTRVPRLCNPPEVVVIDLLPAEP